MYNSLTWSIPVYTRNPALNSNSLSAASPLLVPCWLPLGLYLLYRVVISDGQIQQGAFNDSPNILIERLIFLGFIRFVPSGLRTRPEHKCPTIQRTLPHLKGWNLLNLIA